MSTSETSPSGHAADDEKAINTTTLLRAESTSNGNVVHVQKPFSTLTAIGIGHSVTNTAIALYMTIQSQLPFGGSPAFFYGFLLMAFVGLCSAASLSELASMYPHSGGQYFWVSQLAPKRINAYLTCTTAILSWAGAVCTSASITLVVSSMIIGIAKLLQPSFEPAAWVTFLVYQAVIVGTFPLNCFERVIAVFGRVALAFCIASLITLFVSLLSFSQHKQSASEVFTEFYNVSGWPTGVAFFLSINSPNWAFSCLDSATHLADEIPNPRRNIPKALMWTIAVGTVTGTPTLLAIFFSMQNMEEILDSNLGCASLALFYQVSGSKAAAVGLQALVLVVGLSAVTAIQTWQSRMAWAFSRNQGFPFHKHLSQLAPSPSHTPIWAHAWSCVWTGLLGCVYLGSQTAFNSFISAGILFQYITYAIPIILMLRKGRNNVPRGPFWLGKLGLAANLITLVWSSIALVFYSFPYFLPVEASEMNYVVCILAGFFLYSAGYWLIYGRRHFVLPLASEVVEDLTT